MKKLSLALVLSVLLGSSIAATPLGILFSNVKEPVSASSLASYSKVAKGSTFSVFWLVGLGDASIEKIARDAGITRIKHVDKETTVLPLGVFIQETFTVYGD